MTTTTRRAAMTDPAPTWRTAQTYIAWLEQELRAARYLFRPEERGGWIASTPADEPVRQALADPLVMLARMSPVMRAAGIVVDQIEDPRVWGVFNCGVLDAAFRAAAAKGGAA